jgi:hypothetical protein
VEARSLLGKWNFSGGAGEVGFQADINLGDKIKKVFQEKKVPVFFRGQLPISRRGRRPQILLPGPSAPQEEYTLELSDLGRWWLASTPS